jgi:hypothetical protein
MPLEPSTDSASSATPGLSSSRTALEKGETARDTVSLAPVSASFASLSSYLVLSKTTARIDAVGLRKDSLVTSSLSGELEDVRNLLKEA